MLHDVWTFIQATAPVWVTAWFAVVLLTGLGHAERRFADADRRALRDHKTDLRDSALLFVMALLFGWLAVPALGAGVVGLVGWLLWRTSVTIYSAFSEVAHLGSSTPTTLKEAAPADHGQLTLSPSVGGELSKTHDDYDDADHDLEG